MNSRTTPNPNGVNHMSGVGKWKYTDNANDAECATNWNYYAKDKTTLILGNIPNITMEGDNKNWCALKLPPSQDSEPATLYTMYIILAVVLLLIIIGAFFMLKKKKTNPMTSFGNRLKKMCKRF